MLNTYSMENTLNLLLQDTTLKWYTVVNDRPVGPLSAKEIVQRIRANDLNFASHVWKDGFKGWTRIYDVIDFKPLLPSEPATALLAEIQKSTQAAPPPLAPAQKEELRVWYVYLDESSYGPVSDREVTGLIEAGRISGATYMWTKGFTDWQQGKDIDYWSKRLTRRRPSPPTSALPPASPSRPRFSSPMARKWAGPSAVTFRWAECRFSWTTARALPAPRSSST